MSARDLQRIEAAAQRTIVEPRPIDQLRSYRRNTRKHSKKQIRQIADSIREFGFTNPVLISDDNEVIAGHARVAAAKLLGMDHVPTLCLSHLDATQRRAYVIADNKLALNAGWDHELLAAELQALDLEFDVTLTGFSLAEVSLLVEEMQASAPDPVAAAGDEGTPRQAPLVADRTLSVSRCGDEWLLDHHVLVCGEANLVLCDQVLRHFEQITGRQAVLAVSEESFAAVAAKRALTLAGQGSRR